MNLPPLSRVQRPSTNMHMEDDLYPKSGRSHERLPQKSPAKTSLVKLAKDGMGLRLETPDEMKWLTEFIADVFKERPKKRQQLLERHRIGKLLATESHISKQLDDRLARKRPASHLFGTKDVFCATPCEWNITLSDCNTNSESYSTKDQIQHKRTPGNRDSGRNATKTKCFLKPATPFRNKHLHETLNEGTWTSSSLKRGSSDDLYSNASKSANLGRAPVLLMDTPRTPYINCSGNKYHVKKDAFTMYRLYYLKRKGSPLTRDDYWSLIPTKRRRLLGN